MLKNEPVNLHEQFASDYLRLLKIYLKKKKKTCNKYLCPGAYWVALCIPGRANNRPLQPRLFSHVIIPHVPARANTRSDEFMRNNSECHSGPERAEVGCIAPFSAQHSACWHP